MVCSMILLPHSVCAAEMTPASRCKAIVSTKLPSISGWCSMNKASAMIDLIVEVKPAVCVEIGVYSGASLFPTALTLAFLRHGMVYAIDPWSNAECTKNMQDNTAHKDFWARLDLNSSYESCLRMIQENRLGKFCTVLRQTAEQAVDSIPDIDILHIDANHCDQEDLANILLYFPKIKLGGYIWFDGWATSPKAYDYLKKTCHVTKVVDSGGCILLKKMFLE